MTLEGDCSGQTQAGLSVRRVDRKSRTESPTCVSALVSEEGPGCGDAHGLLALVVDRGVDPGLVGLGAANRHERFAVGVGANADERSARVVLDGNAGKAGGSLGIEAACIRA